jgi:ketosteroid isomerase-like protein
MITKEEAEILAQDWIDAWNSHDIEKIASRYCDAVEFNSPVIVKRLGEPKGKITDKEVLLNYFQGALDAYPDLHFELIDVYVGVNSLVVNYHSRVDNNIYIGSEMMALDDTGKIHLVYAHYDRER